MKLICDCKCDLGKNVKFKLSDFELDEFPICPKCGKMWLDHLVDGLKFASYEEAKLYARDFWIEDGVDEFTVLSFLKLN